ncbi:hypothetical protein H696_05579 [Fonticula alba]|uniref:Uncharacterized protein n=1 Tax=Fonticula alba TaxID=691883 RepID=A0A058Z1N9_FONAL|nr:hypothetical protein H696_05579 [Fonticula alba]KCV67848.1 hypothetical protein H696_05579 [Fonticula alba]|eukprot:XP_009497668.1 hypothetical protein H696_05579 [Fonticula alba]
MDFHNPLFQRLARWTLFFLLNRQKNIALRKMAHFRTLTFTTGLAFGTVAGAYIAQNYNVPNVRECFNTLYDMVMDIERASRKND